MYIAAGEAKEAVQRMGHAVLKPLFSTKARGMIVVDSGDAYLQKNIDAFVVYPYRGRRF